MKRLSFASRLFHDEGGGVALVEQPQFAAGRGGVVGVEEDAAVHQRAVEVSDKRPYVPTRKRGGGGHV